MKNRSLEKKKFQDQNLNCIILSCKFCQTATFVDGRQICKYICNSVNYYDSLGQIKRNNINSKYFLNLIIYTVQLEGLALGNE